MSAYIRALGCCRVYLMRRLCMHVNILHEADDANYENGTSTAMTHTACRTFKAQAVISHFSHGRSDVSIHGGLVDNATRCKVAHNPSKLQALDVVKCCELMHRSLPCSQYSRIR